MNKRVSEELTKENRSPSLLGTGFFSGHTKLVVIISVVAILICSGSLYAAAQVYENNLGPGVKIGPFKVGGTDVEMTRDMLYQATDELLSNGIQVSYQGEIKTIPLSNAHEGEVDLVQDYITFEIDQVLSQATELSHKNNLFMDMVNLAYLSVVRPTVELPYSINQEEILNEIRESFPELNEPPINAGYKITFLNDAWIFEVTEDEPGTVVDESGIFESIEQMLASFIFEPVTIQAAFVDADVSGAEAEATVGEAKAVLSNAPYTLSLEETGEAWEITAEQVAAALILEENQGKVMPILDPAAIELIIDEIAEDVEVEVRDAQLELDGERVVSFTTSQDGIELDRAATMLALAEAWQAGENMAEIVISIVEPRVSMGEINDLGIEEVLGTGISDFSGSPYNRIQNIKHGASKLDGLLIAPDEEFSLVEALKPFTLEDGYLSELVIKGDEIKPEVGGGLCQIGTTTFRAAMNSGLNITERHNHSLVVSYYDDPSNGNPGTDATIYDPWPDFRFVNDTGHYLLFTTTVDEPNRHLYFSFWGTSDGRKGYYTPPVVTSWSSPGETQYVDTADLDPGAEQCQSAHYGANAEFTYYIEQPDGTVEETLYSSHYRALPRICLIGIDPDAPTEEDEEGAEEAADETSEEEITSTEDTSTEETETVTE